MGVSYGTLNFYRDPEVSSYVSLTDTEYIRPFSFGSNWQKLRIGVVLDTTGSPASPVGKWDFTIGVVSGTSNGVKSASCANAVGFRWSLASDAGSWSRTAGANGQRYIQPNGATNDYFHKTGTTYTVPASAINGPYINDDFTNPVRTVFFFDIAKPGIGGTNWGLASSSTNNAPSSAAPIPNMAAFWTAMVSNLATLPVTLTGFGFGSVTPVNIADATVNEATNGSLNALSIYWGTSIVPLRVHAAAVMRIT